MEIGYKNTNEHLYEDIALWEKTEGVTLMKSMPLNGIVNPQIIDVGFGFGQYLFAAAYHTLREGFMELMGQRFV